MTQKEVFDLLEASKNERGIANWQKVEISRKWISYGIGLTELRKMAKKIGRDHSLALALWATECYDAKVLATLIDDPKQITREQVEEQVRDAAFWMLAHVLCSCDSTLSKVPFIFELAEDWIGSPDHVRRRCGYLLLAEMSKDSKDSRLTDVYLLRHIDHIEAHLQSEENFVRDAMNAVLFTVGQRNKVLHTSALAVAKKIGQVSVDYGENSCQALDVVKHLSHERYLKKFA
jgi:3-methyladenine DNA glycosylase AlkD